MFNKKPKITQYECSAKVANPIKIVQLSDLHCNTFGNMNEGLLNAVKEQEPDLILITGDMLLKNREKTIDTERFLQRLAFIAPCFYSLGNHELVYRENFPEKYENFVWGLMECGICLLDDESTIASVKDVELEIGGCTGDMSLYKRFSKPPIYDNLIKPELKEGLKLLLAHNAEMYETFEGSDWDIIFSGHLHGGYVRIPGIGGVISPSVRLFPKYSGGFYKLKNNKKMLVSKGLGEHSISLRIFNPFELTVLTINQEQ